MAPLFSEAVVLKRMRVKQAIAISDVESDLKFGIYAKYLVV